MSPQDMAPRPQINGAIDSSEASALLGEFSALLRRLGSPPTSGASDLHPADVQLYLGSYQASILGPIELPAIARSCQHAARGQWRELLLLDAQLATEPLLQPFSDGSRQIGRMQLERLRPLRDERLSRRYLTAVEAGQAHGWHTLVYGIMLAVYSWPLRQGLIHYGRETLAGLAMAAGAPAVIDENALRQSVDQAISDLNGSYITSIASP